MRRHDSLVDPLAPREPDFSPRARNRPSSARSTDAMNQGRMDHSVTSGESSVAASERLGPAASRRRRRKRGRVNDTDTTTPVSMVQSDHRTTVRPDNSDRRSFISLPSVAQSRPVPPQRAPQGSRPVRPEVLPASASASASSSRPPHVVRSEQSRTSSRRSAASLSIRLQRRHTRREHAEFARAFHLTAPHFLERESATATRPRDAAATVAPARAPSELESKSLSPPQPTPTAAPKPERGAVSSGQRLSINLPGFDYDPATYRYFKRLRNSEVHSDVPNRARPVPTSKGADQPTAAACVSRCSLIRALQLRERGLLDCFSLLTVTAKFGERSLILPSSEPTVCTMTLNCAGTICRSLSLVLGTLCCPSPTAV